jgi:hypothetical protein
MKFKNIALAATVACIAAVVANAQVLKRTTVKTDSVPFGAGGVFSIMGAPVGDIRITATSSNTIEIKATIEVQAANETDLAGAAALTGFVVQETLGRVAVVSVGPDARRKFTSEEKKLIKRLKGMPYRIDYEIGVPKYCSLDVDAGQGELSISGPDGRHRVNGQDSDATVAVSGLLALTLAKGKAKIELRGGRLSGIEASVVSGDISLIRAPGVSGDIDAGILRTGRVVVNDTELKPRDARKFPFIEKLVMARAGSGGPGIKLTVGDGTISLLPPVK